MSARRWIAYKLLISLLFFLSLNCAKVSSPPGGPADKTGPSVITTIPENNSTLVAPNDRITIQFSEAVEKKEVEKAIFISPRFSGDLKYKWKRSTLTLVLPDSFAKNTTYVVSVGSEIRDLRRNRMDNSHIFAFSTGEAINQGKISGRLFKDGKPLSGATVALYDFISPDSTTRFDSLYPPYMTQSGKSGEYSLEYIPDGEYFLLAFVDKNKNQLFDFPREAVGVPDRSARVSGGIPKPGIDFFLVEQDTASIKIVSVMPAQDHLVKVRFSGKIESDSLRNNFHRIHLVPSEAGAPRLNPSSIKEGEGVQASTYNFFFRSLTDGQYRLKIDAAIFGGRKDSASVTESTEFTIQLSPDDNAPKLEDVSHSGKTIFPSDSIIKMSFSEPIERERMGDGVIKIIDSDSSQCDIAYHWPDDFLMNLHVTGLDWGGSYSVAVAESFFADLSGNRAGDSILQYEFKTYDKDSLGSVSGSLAFDPTLDTTGAAYLIFSTIKGQEISRRLITGGSFSYDLPPGRYFLSGFIDRNINGHHDYGTLFPFNYAETASFHPDTIRVRARFETAGIEFKFD